MLACVGSTSRARNAPPVMQPVAPRPEAARISWYFGSVIVSPAEWLVVASPGASLLRRRVGALESWHASEFDWKPGRRAGKGSRREGWPFAANHERKRRGSGKACRCSGPFDRTTNTDIVQALPDHGGFLKCESHGLG
jgi:hypothetical protein